MSRRTEKRKYGKYNKFDVVYADFGKNPHGIQGGIRPGIIISCDASNHDGAPQVSVVPLSSKLSAFVGSGVNGIPLIININIIGC